MNCRRIIIVVFISLVLLFSSCYSGLEYSPINMKDKEEFSKIKLEKLDIKVSKIGELIGVKGIRLKLAIMNHCDKVVLIEDAYLESGGNVYKMALGRFYNNWEKINPQSEVTNTLYWTFNKPIFEILQDTVKVKVFIKIGCERKEIEIPMKKTVG